MSRITNQIDYRRRITGALPNPKQFGLKPVPKPAKKAVKPTQLPKGFQRRGREIYGPDNKPLTLAQIMGKAELPEIPPAASEVAAEAATQAPLLAGEFAAKNETTVSVESGAVPAVTTAVVSKPSPPLLDSLNMLPHRQHRPQSGEQGIDMMSGVKEVKRPAGHNQQNSPLNPNAQLQQTLKEGMEAAKKAKKDPIL